MGGQREGDAVHLVAYKHHDLGDLLQKVQERSGDQGGMGWAQRNRNFVEVTFGNLTKRVGRNAPNPSPSVAYRSPQRAICSDRSDAGPMRPARGHCSIELCCNAAGVLMMAATR